MTQQKRISEIGYLKPPPPSEIEYKNLHFLIMDRPTDENIHYFLEELKSKNVKDVVRVCDPTYETDSLKAQGIRVLDWPFDDGKPPPIEVVDDWFHLLRERFTNDPDSCIAVHCVAGLGRAPVLVAIALIESGMKYYDAVELIRKKRRGAINAKQLEYLEHYKPKSRLKYKNQNKQCCIS